MMLYQNEKSDVDSADFALEIQIYSSSAPEKRKETEIGVVLGFSKESLI